VVPFDCQGKEGAAGRLLVVSVVRWSYFFLPARLAAQYFFIRADTA
jgi:hypothetical protein